MWHDWQKARKWWLLCLLVLVAFVLYIIIDARKTDVRGKVVVCIPVYGQSLALGEEAVRITDFDELVEKSNNRIVTESMDDKFGYFDGSTFKQYVKRLLHYRKRSFELSVYGMAEALTQQLGSDTVICTFPGGQGATALAQLSKGTPPYQRFISDIAKACQLAQKGDCKRFFVPAVCFLQGESDIVDYPDTEFKQLLIQFKEDINRDIKAVTHQNEDVRIIAYQPTALSCARKYNATSFDCHEAQVPQTFVDMLLTDTMFWASSPTYPFTIVNEYLHLDGSSQQKLGYIEALSALAILRHQQRISGLLPTSVEAGCLEDSTSGNLILNDQTTKRPNDCVIVHFSVPCPPLVLDTVQVAKAKNYGFSVISPDNQDIATAVIIDSCTVRILCSTSPDSCKVRYGVNGDYMKSGNRHGPRGNLRDSQGNRLTVDIAGVKYPLHNWAFQFDELITK